ncbi:chemotaxis protein CheB [Chitinophaga agrisoli]|uniref:protein-glutamate methylesterase n=1 Tax=Chitinophaga agrisoli TaxID=2607653 RepID=A0A5B2VIR2_9BACT|nr:chemotaxis protein CheB [Chitinophaga agrisoli]KAA2238410.1 chemotaxis protein CheB [Chitinophaga agrisoli]
MECKYLVAIGCSAGGLQPLIAFFDHTPLDSAAYVILQHLPYDYESKLKQILARYSEMKIVIPESGMPITANWVYTLPARMYLNVSGDNISPVARDEKAGRNYAFDCFLNSIPDKPDLDVIAVVLSGNGADGSQGIHRVKQTGGRVLAQLPESCEFPAMPTNAIHTGLVDFVALPKDIPRIIQEDVIPAFEALPE